MNNFIDRLNGNKVFNKIDLLSGYHKVRIKESNQYIAALQSLWGLYQYIVIPFGLVNIPDTFQHIINNILWNSLHAFCIVHLDDILIFSKNTEEH